MQAERVLRGVDNTHGYVSQEGHRTIGEHILAGIDDQYIEALANYALADLFLRLRPEFSFPAVWGDQDGHGSPPPDDVATVRFYFQITHDDQHIMFEVSLGKMVDEVMEDSLDNGFLEKLRDRLIELANKINGAVTSSDVAT